MKYYTGLFAFTQYADPDESSIGLVREYEEYNNIRDQFIKDSDDSILKDYGIRQVAEISNINSVITCASHTRAYLDMLIDHQFKDLEGMPLKNVVDGKDISKVFYKCLDYGLLNDEDILNFLNREFESYFRSFLIAVGDDSHLSKLLGDNV